MLNLEEIGLATFTEDELIKLSQAIDAEYSRRRTLASAKEQMESLAQEYAEAVKDSPAEEFAPGKVIGPGERILVKGIEYVNTSGAFLSVSPDDYPLGFQLADAPEPEAFPEWNPNSYQYKQGDQFNYKGTVYKVIQAHTSAPHWTPDAVASLYSKS